ncbi:MAG: hypothetical protein HY360_18060 [Verrucomicrobia bacterium]|nr:hypothetical protein [Verrucomicrobiota bacterium]
MNATIIAARNLLPIVLLLDGISPVFAKIILKDTFNSVAESTTCPEIAPANYSGVILEGDVKTVNAGRKKGVLLDGIARIIYPTDGLPILSSGGIATRVYINFDPEKNDRPNLRNTVFFTIFGPGKSSVTCYSVYHKEIRVLVRNEEGAEVLMKVLPVLWEPYDPHDISVTWGKRMELTCDGETAGENWQGLFNAHEVNPDDIRLIVGSWDNKSPGESCFTIEKLEIDDGHASSAGAMPAEDIMSHYKTQSVLIGYPPVPPPRSELSGPPKPADVRHSLRMTEFKGSDGLTQEEADKRALEFKSQGFNVLLSQYKNRYLFFDRDAQKRTYFPNHPNYDVFIKDTRTLVQAAHKYGLKFFIHLTATTVEKDVIDAHPDWAAIDITTGQSPVNSYGSYMTCINSDAFMAEYLKRLERFVRETGVDGIMQDEIQFLDFNLCGCRSCREKYRKETGAGIPACIVRDWAWHHHVHEEPYQKWIDWRRRCVVQKMQHLRKTVKKVNPDIIITHYLCNNTHGSILPSTGLVINDYPGFADQIGYECEPPLYRNHLYIYYRQLVVAEMKYMRAVAERMGSGMWTYFYERRPGDYTWNWLMALSQGSRVWWNADRTAENQWGPLVAWEAKCQNILAGLKTSANIGVFFSIKDSAYITYMEQEKRFQHGFLSVCQALSDGHVPYRIILEDDLNGEALLKKIKTLWLPNARALSSGELEAIRAFVKGGGNVIATAKTSLCTERGDKRDNFALADLLGCDYAGEFQRKNRLAIKTANEICGKITGEFEHNESFVLLKNIASDVKIMAYYKDLSGREFPGILLRKVGTGCVIYSAGHLEDKYFYSMPGFNEIALGTNWTDKRIPAYQELICNIAAYNNREIPLLVKNLPRGILAEVYRHQTDRFNGVEVHLGNFLGGEIKSGPIPAEPLISFPEAQRQLPAPDKPVELSVFAPDAKKVFLLSPDFDETVELPHARNGKYVDVSLPVFYRYFILYVNEGDPAGLLELTGGKIANAIPKAKQLVTREIEPLAGKYDANDHVVFSDSPRMQGGWLINPYKNFPGQFVYGAQSGCSNLTATIVMDKKMENAVLEIGAMDDNYPTKALIQILVNDRTVCKGPSAYPDNDWGVRKLAVEDGWLKQGTNTVRIQNLEPGARGSHPWVGVNFIKIRPKKD